MERSREGQEAGHSERPQHLVEKTVIGIFQFDIAPPYSTTHVEVIQEIMLRNMDVILHLYNLSL